MPIETVKQASLTVKFSSLKPTVCIKNGLHFHGHKHTFPASVLQQESLANTKVNARQHCVSLSCICNSLTQIEWVVQLFCLPNTRNHAKFRENSTLQQFKVIQGHRSWCQSKAHM